MEEHKTLIVEKTPCEGLQQFQPPFTWEATDIQVCEHTFRGAHRAASSVHVQGTSMMVFVKGGPNFKSIILGLGGNSIARSLHLIQIPSFQVLKANSEHGA